MIFQSLLSIGVQCWEMPLMCVTLLLIFQWQVTVIDSERCIPVRRLLAAGAAFIAAVALWDICFYILEPAGMFPVLYVVNFLYNLTGFILASAFYYCFRFTLKRSELFGNKLYLSSLVLFVVLSVLYWCCYFTDLFVRQGERGYFVTGMLDYLWYIPIYLPIVFISFHSIIAFFDKHRYSERHEHQLIIFFLITLSLSVFGDIIYPHIHILSFGVTICACICFLGAITSLISADELTGLRNRRQLLRDMAKKFQVGRQWGVIILDLDDFKSINDSFGHEEGDIALKLFADILKLSCRGKNARPYRIGGDEFVVVKEGYTGDIERELQEMQSIINRRVQLVDARIKKDYHLSASSGICSSETADSIPDIMRCADRLMYEYKKKRNSK